MSKTISRWLALFLVVAGALCSLPGGVRAATIGIEASPPTVLVGDVVEIRIFGVGFEEGTDGGDFALSWDPSFSFVDLAIEDPPWDLSSYDAAGTGAGEITNVDIFSFIDTPGIGGVRFEIATLRLLAGAAAAAQIVVAPAQVGWSLGGDPVAVAYGAPMTIEILAVPEPATASLLGLGLACLSRRRSGRPGIMRKA